MGKKAKTSKSHSWKGSLVEVYSILLLARKSHEPPEKQIEFCEVVLGCGSNGVWITQDTAPLVFVTVLLLFSRLTL